MALHRTAGSARLLPRLWWLVIVSLAPLAYVLHGCATAAAVAPAVGNVAGPIITKKVARDVIADAEQAGQNLLSQAERTGNALAGRLGNELNVAAANAIRLAGDEADRKVEDLSKEVSVVVNALNDLIEQANQFQKGAFDLKDAMALDLRGAMGDIRFFVSKTNFMIQRIDGVTQLENKKGAEYKVVLTGLGLGPDTSKMRNRITSVTIDGKTTSFVETRPRVYRTEIVFQNKALAPYFEDSKLVFVSLQVSVAVETKKMFGWNTQNYTVPVRVGLMPRSAGKVTVAWATEKLDWVNTLPEPFKDSHTTPDHNCHSGDCRFFPESKQVKVPGNQRYVNAQIFGSSGEGCPWTRNSRASVLGGGTILEFWTEAQGSPCTHTFGAMIQELRVVGETPGTRSYNLRYGENLVVELPTGTKFWRIRGTTSAFQGIDVVMDQSDDVLKYRKTADTAEKKRVVYYVNKPTGAE